ncbi:hypothetical protein SBA4_390006 [Candidatus Sulfopaludibacter sp. SbA4]|nr:hypothetical protein SBA4_390006 [Candidatus Sulfopaludibacter sp. SbA4]
MGRWRVGRRRDSELVHRKLRRRRIDASSEIVVLLKERDLPKVRRRIDASPPPYGGINEKQLPSAGSCLESASLFLI